MISFSVLVLLQRDNELKDDKRTSGLDRLMSRFIPIHTISGRLVKNVNKFHEMR